jgi:hypothetical protein
MPSYYALLSSFTTTHDLCHLQVELPAIEMISGVDALLLHCVVIAYLGRLQQLVLQSSRWSRIRQSDGTFLSSNLAVLARCSLSI